MTTEPRGLHAPFSAAVLRAIPMGALLVGDDGRVVAANPQFSEVCGLHGVDTATGAPADPIADAVARLLPERDAAALRSLRGQFVRKAEIRLRDGRTLRRSRQPIDAGEQHLGVLWLVEDVTEQRRYEADLHRHIDTLGELARDRAEFAARTSHELRTPLATVLTFCELLSDPATGALGEVQREYLDTIRRAATRMQDMADGLLHRYAEAASGAPPSFAPLAPGPLLARLVHDITPWATRDGVFVALDLPGGEPPPLTADADQLERALTALLDNAVKFTPAGGTVTVTARPSEGSDDGDRPPGWRITVADSGIGIPKEFQEEVFTEFVRAPNARRGAYPGTGLGLSVVRDAVRLHSGTVTVHSDEGHGTGVEVWLPLGGPPGSGPA
ncbi:PAS domain-containing sensor histidine kinase [Streptomyces spectabilis]|uniref:histidine kinase n=1 Tax=Streptomyces spectabilis TaxID=68270 RepID=A0A516R7D9_STRST|nr:PAS domain-containing sensor histidine kinase [Streptomyces spectabilis]QDQ11550.1 sensor histidine kinase [Streptomyces spectabilis]